MTMTMNSFQKWADDYGRAHGFIVLMTGNWVTMLKDDLSEVCHSAAGVQAVCDRDAEKRDAPEAL
ncbi:MULTISPECIES: hypothetical protein [Paracoccus]|uniref:hypothetical protein n=1 Tax=Paracoccus TaxID=265 RepID=UPI00086AE2FB|nr:MULTISPECIES: hypothetical protein [Paracoccus]ODT60974.1 MAG: hypothetical protein ABS73_03815 [Paracoccus sp. SCN 68-21]